SVNYRSRSCSFLSIRNRNSPPRFSPKQIRFELLLTRSVRRGKQILKMTMKLYVGNLSFNTTNQDLNDHFGEIGTVESTNIIEDRDTGRSRGFGFVEMASKEEGEQAIEQLNGKEVDGRELKV